MGYQHYDTPAGAAGYGVQDVCNEDGCTEQIDRGLAYLCGDQPGYASGDGCGRWFCGHHLFVPLGSRRGCVGGAARRPISAVDPLTGVMLAAGGALYLGWCWVWPYRPCWRCHGRTTSGDGRGNFRMRRACWVCKGRPYRRLGARLIGRG